MLRPERMSKVSITGSKSVMEPAIETLHDLALLHLEEYDETWEAFRCGDPLEHAEAVSEDLVTVRSLENTLGLERDDVVPARLPDEDAARVRLEEVRTRVNDLDDERSSIRDELRGVRDELERLGPLATLGIDIDLLHGYERIDLAVGYGSEERVREALERSDEVAGYETFEADGVVAIAADPADGAESPISDALVGVEFTQVEVPTVTGDPVERRHELQRERKRLENDLERVETDLKDVELAHGGFLVAYEEALTIEVQRAEAPLWFATSEHAFIAEGWIPTARYDQLREALQASVGDRVEVDELAQAGYEPPADAHGGGEVSADGGHLEMHGPHPPVVQSNPDIVRPFEIFVKTVNRPRYHELDPTIIVFLTFPLAFGYMIGDMGYGLLYILMGWAILRYTDSEGWWALGMIAVWIGVFTALFGYLYDDLFGVHLADFGVLLPLAGTLDKGLQVVEIAQFWIIISILFGVFHLSVGFVLGFVNQLHHGVLTAFEEKGSWLLVLIGFFLWLFTTSHQGTRPEWLLPDSLNLGLVSVNLAETDFTATGLKPEFLVGTSSVLYQNSIVALGFAGFTETVALVGLLMVAVGAVLAVRGEGAIAAVELPTNMLGHAISYIRLMAVLLAKGGMAFVVNLLVFGAYETEAGYVIFHLPGTDVTGYEQQFVGLIHADPLVVTLPAALLVFVSGHVTVLLLGLTAAGIQMTRLEYVEFFGKFYEGGGESFEPFGYKRTYTEET